MPEQRTYEELVELLQEGKINHLQFIMESDNAEEFKQWCEDHGTEPSDESAEFYIDRTDTSMMDSQEMDDEAYGVW